MIAEISSGNHDTSDVFFLIAVIVFLIGVIVPWITWIYRPVAYSAGALGLAFLALGLLVL